MEIELLDLKIGGNLLKMLGRLIGDHVNRAI